MKHADLDHICALEERLLSAQVRGSEAEMTRLLAPDFIEFGASGRIWSRSEIVRNLQQERPARRIVDDFQARMLAPGVVLATYRVRRLDQSGSLEQASLRSSLWVRDGSDWRMLFHQGTAQPL